MPNITLHFAETLLVDDELMVLDATANMIDLSDVMGGWPISGDMSGGDMNTYNAKLGPTSALEVEFNGNATHTAASGSESARWASARQVGTILAGAVSTKRPGSDTRGGPMSKSRSGPTRSSVPR